ncbi:hypothetical protein GGS21DRAFT_315985 [Xylaria nigripes]|nr:hypothetical protein GGS21DRAFT_315985 [Xylaria nigripes]
MKQMTLWPSACLHSALVLGYPSRAQNPCLDNSHPDIQNYHENAGVLRYVNTHIRTFGTSPNDNGGMIPSVSVPFGITRWSAQMRENFTSQVSYHDNDSFVHSFPAAHQPAIGMGELGQAVIVPGWNEEIQPAFEQRGLAFRKDDKSSSPSAYEVILDADTEGEHDRELAETTAEGGPIPGGAGSVHKRSKMGQMVDREEGRLGRRYADAEFELP